MITTDQFYLRFIRKKIDLQCIMLIVQCHHLNLSIEILLVPLLLASAVIINPTIQYKLVGIFPTTSHEPQLNR